MDWKDILKIAFKALFLIILVVIFAALTLVHVISGKASEIVEGVIKTLKQ